MAGNPYEVELLTQEYSSTLGLLLQQKVSRLRSLIASSGGHVGKQASPVQYVGNVEFTAPGQRYSQLQFQSPSYLRRWVTPVEKEVTVPIDRWDMLRTIVDPTAQLNEVVVAGANRFFDDTIVNSAFATAKTGEVGATDETWPASTFVVAVDFGGGGSSVGLTYEKFVEAKRILRHWENDVTAISPIVIAGSTQESDLSKQEVIISSDYSSGKVVENGSVTRVYGCNIAYSERVPWASNVRSVIMTMPDGLYLGIWKDLDINVTQRTDLSGQPWQIYAMVVCGATRLQLGKVVEIKCADTVGLPVTPGVYS